MLDQLVHRADPACEQVEQTSPTGVIEPVVSLVLEPVADGG